MLPFLTKWLVIFAPLPTMHHFFGIIYLTLFILPLLTVEPIYVAPIKLTMFYGKKPGWRHNQYHGLVH